MQDFVNERRTIKYARFMHVLYGNWSLDYHTQFYRNIGMLFASHNLFSYLTLFNEFLN